MSVPKKAFSLSGASQRDRPNRTSGSFDQEKASWTKRPRKGVRNLIYNFVMQFLCRDFLNLEFFRRFFGFFLRDFTG